jgi:hypothetical protein
MVVLNAITLKSGIQAIKKENIKMGLDMFLMCDDEEIGYWRKHPNLHGFIVQTFADGIDKCQKIPLTLSDVKKIIFATKNKMLPLTTGFFFGQSYPEYDQDTLDIFEVAKKRLEKDPDCELYYRASW